MSSIMIKHLDGTIYDLDALGFRVVSYNPPTASVTYTYQQIGNYGAKLTGAQTAQLVIPLTLVITARDMNDYRLQLIELHKIFYTDEYFFVYDSKIPYLRYKVRAEQISPTQNGNFWQSNNVTINLDCPSGYAESTYTSLEMAKDHSLMGFGVNLPVEQDFQAQFNTSDFIFTNIGLIPLQADERPVTITFNGSVASALTITNQTTNQSLKISKSLSASDTLTITGFMPAVNGTPIYGDSDHGYIDFVRGDNQIHIDGTTSFKISFDTRFYY
ncbi:phage tail family protein [Limosilactobacillus fermentum]